MDLPVGGAVAVRDETAHAAATGGTVTRDRGTGGAPDGAVARWAAENPRSAALSARAQHLLPGGVTHDVRLADPFPLAVAHAEGARKWDLDGHELVCYVLGHGALLLGHCHPEVVSAVRAQAGRFFHPGASHELECDWAELVIRLVPSAERVRFTSSGTEASLLALRVARAATGRDRIVKLSGHFHGWHDQVAVGSDPPFDRPDTAGLPRATAETVTVIPADARALAGALQAGDVAAVILEPSGAAWGTVPLPGGFLAEARRLTGAAGALLVYDEVVSGFRWAPGGVQEVTGVNPDLTVLGKVLAGGMPGGAVCGRADLVDHLAGPAAGPNRVAHPGTHNAHALSAAAGVTTLRLAAPGDLQAGADALAASLRDELTAAFQRAGVAGCAYGESSTFHLLFGHGGTAGGLDAAALKHGVPGSLFPALQCAMLSRGVHLFHGSGFLSAAHGDREVEQTAAAFAATLRQLQLEGLV
ncbi:MAG TPA: aminotransferase class III-fold pyridoxal phosphate-dependent enzyme [Streptosporangiaceae bacterium]|nr:aminotransferase class III-fold pyridoxal phosphate-dependent enzyme [Streptosporangiaceae bacterium]